VEIGTATGIGSGGRLRGQAAAPQRLLREYSLRAVVVLILRWLAAFRSDHAPGIITSRLEAGKSRFHSTAEQAAFEQLFARYRQPLLDYLYGMIRDRATAEDLVQETFLRAYTANTSLASVSHPQAWLYRIATNVALDTGRHRGHFNWVPLHRVEPGAGHDESGFRSESFPSAMRQGDFAASVAERDAVWRVLAELPPRWRAVLLLQTTAGFGVRDIGRLLHLSDSNVRKILFRAKERFRAIYARQGATEAEGGRS
jgi:RNA polymerase sigma factor (sigma-70 family)